MPRPSYRYVRSLRQTQKCRLNEVTFNLFESGDPRFLLIDHVVSNFVVVILSPVATVAAHLPAFVNADNPSRNADYTNTVRKMRDIRHLFRDTYPECFEDGCVAVVLYARIQGSTAWPQKKELIKDQLERMALDPIMIGYEVNMYNDGRTAVFVDGENSTLYLENNGLRKLVGLQS